MASLPNPIGAAIVGYLSRLRFPALLAITGVLFVVDLVVPDLLPLADEILLGLATVLFASWRKRREPDEPDEPGEAGEAGEAT